MNVNLGRLVFGRVEADLVAGFELSWHGLGKPSGEIRRYSARYVPRSATGNSILPSCRWFARLPLGESEALPFMAGSGHTLRLVMAGTFEC
jgi:hypothetical protein